jgi:hypothetical protein
LLKNIFAQLTDFYSFWEKTPAYGISFAIELPEYCVWFILTHHYFPLPGSLQSAFCKNKDISKYSTGIIDHHGPGTNLGFRTE